MVVVWVPVCRVTRCGFTRTGNWRGSKLGWVLSAKLKRGTFCDRRVQERTVESRGMPSLYRKTCPKCSRVFTHPPAFSIHGKSCGVNSAAPEQGQSATCKPISAAVAPTRPSIGPPPKGEGETALRTAPVPLYFKQLESELLTSEIKFKDAKEQEAYVKDMAQQQARNNLTSDNIVVDFGWEPKNDHVKSTPEPATLNAAHGKSEDSTEESSSDFERSDEEYSVGAAAQPAPVSHGKPKLKGAKTLALKRGDGTVDGKYAALIDKVGTAPDHARLAAMSLDDLRFLLRKNGTSSHNMLKMPVVRCDCHSYALVSQISHASCCPPGDCARKDSKHHRTPVRGGAHVGTNRQKAPAIGSVLRNSRGEKAQGWRCDHPGCCCGSPQSLKQARAQAEPAGQRLCGPVYNRPGLLPRLHRRRVRQ